MTQRVQAVERALWLLEAVASADQPPTAPELAVVAGVNRATTWRLLNTLVHFGLVVRDEVTARYSVGAGVLRLAAAASGDHLVRVARPVLEQLADRTGGAAYLEIATRGRLVVLDECRAASPVQIDLAGLDVPLHCGSVGKLHLATWSESDLDDYVSGGLAAPTANTLADPEVLRADVVQAGIAGVAFNYGEHLEQWCGVSSAVRDDNGRDLAYLNVTLPTWTTSEAELHALGPVLFESARTLADRLSSPERSDSMS